MCTPPVHSRRTIAKMRWSAIPLSPRSTASRIHESQGPQRRHAFGSFHFLLAVVIVLHAAVASFSITTAHGLPLAGPASVTVAAQVDPPLLLSDPLPPAIPAAPWSTLNESLLPYPVFYPAIAVLNNSILLLGGCVTATCETPVDEFVTTTAAIRPHEYTATSPYHEQLISLNVEKGSIAAVPRLTLPAGLGFAGRHAAVTLTDSVYVARSCTMTTRSPEEVLNMTAEELQVMQAAYAPVVAFYPEGGVDSRTHAGDPDPPPAVNLTYFEVPANRVRVNASCTALSTANKLLIIGGFLLSAQRVTASVDSFDVVTRKYEVDVAFLSVPALQPSVATSTGFAAVAGGWMYESDTTVGATGETESPPEVRGVKRSSGLSASGKSLHRPKKLTALPGKLSASPFSDASSSSSSRLVRRYLFDLLFFDSDSPARGAVGTGGIICTSPVDASALPRTVVEDILLSVNGCHVTLFGGQVILTDHNLDHIAVLDIRATTAWDFAARAPLVPPPPLAVTLLQTAKVNAPARAVVDTASAASHNITASHKGRGVRRCAESSSRHHDHAASTVLSARGGNSGGSDSTSTSSSTSSSGAIASSSSLPTPTPTPPPPVYRYSWMQPTLIPLPYPRPPTSTATPDPTAMTDTILIYYAIGGEDVWSQVVTNEDDVAADRLLGTSPMPRGVQRLHSSPSALRATLDGAEVVVRQEPALRWAQRVLPDMNYDSDRPDLLAVTMPTPVWPDALTLQTTSEGIIHLQFPDLNYTRYCTWKRHDDDDDVVCAVRLSSRRDCVGNTAGTLDSAYNGAPNTTVLFSASGSTNPVYVCFSYVVRPTSWPVCRIRQSFSVLNPMMPLRILDNSHTTAAPSPSPTRDPADSTTSSPLFMLAVSVAVVTLLVAVLLVARLQHVPEDGLLVMSLLDRDDGAGAQHASSTTRSDGSARCCRRRRRKRLLRGSGEDNSSGLYDAVLGGGGSAEGGDDALKVADVGDDDEIDRHPISTYAEFLHVVNCAQEDSEARMLASAADVLRLHQHRYRVLSRVGQGAHSLCFLAHRKAPPLPLPPAVQQQQQQQLKVRSVGTGIGRGVRALEGVASAITRVSPFTRPPPPFAAATTLPSIATSSLWAARHNQSTAVVVKYTQCPDDATRAVITRLCERLRDLHTGAVTSALGETEIYGSHGNGASSRHPHRRYLPSDMPWTSAAGGLRPSHVSAQVTRDVAREVVRGTGSTGRGAATVEGLKAAAEDATVPPASGRSSSAATVTTASQTGCQALPPLPFPADVAGVIDGDNDDGSCAWLDAHEVNVVLSLFLLLPEDLFVSYEVSVLYQQNNSSQHAHVHCGGRLTPLSVSRGAVDWNRSHIWFGENSVQAEASHQCQPHQCISMPPVPQSFLTQSTPRVCWAACVNLLQPSTVSPWSLCLVMPYERNGNLAEFILRCQQIQLPPTDLASARDTESTNLSSSSSRSVPLARVAPVRYCWTESLLCSVLFQVCTGLQLLHAQSPPILHGNIKETNLLLREPASFSVARRRVVVAETPAALEGMRMGGGSGGRSGPPDAKGGLDMAAATTRVPRTQQPNGEEDDRRDGRVEARTAAAPATFWRAGRSAEATTAAWYAGSPVGYPSSFFVGSPPPLHREGAAMPRSTAARSQSVLQKGQVQPQLQECDPLQPQELEQHLLSARTYLPISLTDGGMSWWLTVQLPLRLRGCFGPTTRSTLRQTPAGLCWLHRFHSSPPSSSPPITTKSSVIPFDGCIVALAHFLFTFIEVPTHIAPELLWGQLCTLSQADHGVEEGGAVAAALAVPHSSLTQPPPSLYSTRTRREQYVPNSRRDGRCRRGNSDSTTRRRCGDAALEPASSPVVGSANPVSTTASDELSANATEDMQGLGGLPQPQRQDDPYADEDMVDKDVEIDADEDGIFTREEVSALTSAMWKAEGLSRVPHNRRLHCPSSPQQPAAAAAADPSIPGASTTTSGGSGAPGKTTLLLLNSISAAGGRRGQLSSFSEASLLANPTTAAAGASSNSSTQLTSQAVPPRLRISSSLRASPNSTLHHCHDVDRQPCSNSSSGGRRMTGGGGSVGGGGSRSNSKVYELLIQRVLAMDTASDVWSLGILLYGMCADAVDGHQQQQQQETSTPTRMSKPSQLHSTAVNGSRSHAHEASTTDTLPPAILTCTGASRLAQQAFSALLGDLYELSVAGVPSGYRGNKGCPCNASAGLQSVGVDVDDGAGVDQLDDNADDRLRWPRSCALEDEVMKAICEAGYTHAFAVILASMLSPVAARRPSAGNIVSQLRLVTAAAPASAASSTMRDGGGGVAGETCEYRVAQQRARLRAHHSGASDITSAAVLHECTARMALRSTMIADTQRSDINV
ncbi:protein kinase, putative [Leishmania panamensis]|uniref:non-specific serine/threonine protein kinase n=1 Tax=Leishmania panamensis TaxID=5679 RepID=A0A088RIP5_LEIPA|nr:protein kinase, putative [Leishmania panamensis]AIN95862.1 protein kinase, putative [Leishmania panamensis]